MDSGGMLDHGEDPWTAARREMNEETGADLDAVPRLIGTDHRADVENTGPVIDYFFHGGVHTGARPIRLSHEHDLHAFKHLDELQDTPLAARLQTLTALHAAARSGTAVYLREGARYDRTRSGPSDHCGSRPPRSTGTWPRPSPSVDSSSPLAASSNSPDDQSALQRLERQPACSAISAGRGRPRWVRSRQRRRTHPSEPLGRSRSAVREGTRSRPSADHVSRRHPLGVTSGPRRRNASRRAPRAMGAHDGLRDRYVMETWGPTLEREAAQ